MMWLRALRFGVVLTCSMVAFSAPGHATMIDVGSDGSDGSLIVTQDTVINLAEAPTAACTTPGDGRGVYDPDKWAVIFKYSSVDIAAGATVTFVNHVKNAPVVWLVAGNVTVAGLVDLSGKKGDASMFSDPGPGGFRGGSAPGTHSAGSAGFGPGGGSVGGVGGGGSYGTQGNGDAGPTYGSPEILPLIGGSGGTYGYSWAGGPGGGAILIAAGGTIDCAGEIRADGANGSGTLNGGGPAGAGGAIRLLADRVVGAGMLHARGNWYSHDGGAGRIRIEANAIEFPPGGSDPEYSALAPLDPGGPVVWPPSSYATLRVVAVAGVPVPEDPTPTFALPAEVMLQEHGPVTIDLQATNMPTDWSVTLRMVRIAGSDTTVAAQLVGGSQSASSWSAVVESLVPEGFVAFQARGASPAP